MTARAAFKEGDLRRALRVAVSEGLSVARIEVNDNGAFLVFGEPDGKRRRANMADKLYGPQG